MQSYKSISSANELQYVANLAYVFCMIPVISGTAYWQHINNPNIMKSLYVHCPVYTGVS